jgi:hypothetical protein
MRPLSPNISSTICLVSFSFIPTLFLMCRDMFSLKCLEQSVSSELGKLDFIALTNAFSSSDFDIARYQTLTFRNRVKI